MDDNAKTLITLGVLFLCGFVTDAIGRRTRLPRVTLLLILGFAIGASELDSFRQARSVVVSEAVQSDFWVTFKSVYPKVA